MSELSISYNQIKKLNNNAKCIYFTLLKKRQDRSLTYKDKMVFISLNYIIPLFDDLLNENQESLINATRLKYFILAVSLLNLGEEQDFSKYNLPLFDYQFNIIKYNIFKKYKNEIEDFNQIESNYNNVKLNFDIMFERDTFHTKGKKLKQILDSYYPYLLGRDLDNIIRVNLGYLYSNMYSRLEEMNSLIDYRDLTNKYIYIYLDQSFYLLNIIFNEYECQDLISRSHQIKSNNLKLVNLLKNQEDLFKDISAKLNTINPNSFLVRFLNEFIKLEKSNLSSIQNKRIYDLNIIFIELVKMYINLSLCKKDINSLINYNFNNSLNNLDISSDEFKYKYNEIKNRITTPNLYLGDNINTLFKNCLKDTFLLKEDINLLTKEFDIKQKIVIPNGFVFFEDEDKLLIDKKALTLIYKLIFKTLKESLFKFKDILDFNNEIKQLEELEEKVSCEFIY